MCRSSCRCSGKSRRVQLVFDRAVHAIYATGFFFTPPENQEEVPPFETDSRQGRAMATQQEQRRTQQPRHIGPTTVHRAKGVRR
jgi:hypothetical protein